MLKTKGLACSLALLAASGFSQTNQVKQKPDSPSGPVQQSKFVPAQGSTVDAKTGLPTRIVHKPSGIVLVLIQAGDFQMGSPENEVGRNSKEERQHRRVISKPFYLGETEVTVGQFRKFALATRYKTDAERGTPDGGETTGAFAAIARRQQVLVCRGKLAESVSESQRLSPAR